jgi:dolichol-phosphate mannosyltransferase
VEARGIMERELIPGEKTARIKILAMVPTYNEAGHIRALVEDILCQDPRLEVLVVDDDSPDGTWRIVSGLAARNPRVHLLHRRAGRGRGSAGLAGFGKALEMGADLVLEMDGDYSHEPGDIPRFLEAAREADLVIGSRLVQGGQDLRAGYWRGWLTLLCAAYVRGVLRVPVKDPTSGYRCFRREVLERVGLERMRSRGPSVVEEVLFACHRMGFRIREIPIKFGQRRSGSSKLNPARLLETACFVTRLALAGR